MLAVLLYMRREETLRYSRTLCTQVQGNTAMEETTASTDTIEQLYARYHQPVRHYLERLVSDREAAEDLMQETFIKALLHWHEVSTTAALRTWLYRIATNTAYDHLRRRRRAEIVSLTDKHATPDASATLETLVDDVEPIRAAMQQLPTRYRLPLLLSLAGYNHQDIANAMDVTVNTIKTRVHRARAQFRHYYVA